MTVPMGEPDSPLVVRVPEWNVIQVDWKRLQKFMEALDDDDSEDSAN